jgi:hypothetical protein
MIAITVSATGLKTIIAAQATITSNARFANPLARRTVAIRRGSVMRLGPAAGVDAAQDDGRVTRVALREVVDPASVLPEITRRKLFAIAKSPIMPAL